MIRVRSAWGETGRLLGTKETDKTLYDVCVPKNRGAERKKTHVDAGGENDHAQTGRRGSGFARRWAMKEDLKKRSLRGPLGRGKKSVTAQRDSVGQTGARLRVASTTRRSRNARSTSNMKGEDRDHQLSAHVVAQRAVVRRF